MRVAPASSAFSTSSFTAAAGRSITSPAAMRLTVCAGRMRMAGIASGLAGDSIGDHESSPRQALRAKRHLPRWAFVPTLSACTTQAHRQLSPRSARKRAISPVVDESLRPRHHAGLQLRQDPAGQFLAQLDAPLVETVDAPDAALHRHLVLIQRDQPPQAERIQPTEQDGVGGPFADTHPMRRHSVDLRLRAPFAAISARISASDRPRNSASA